MTMADNLKYNKALNRKMQKKFGNSSHYFKYDNYDAIEVPITEAIPDDYYGVMGVPITFMGKYNPEQFEVLGCSYVYGDPKCHYDGKPWSTTVNGVDVYKRIFIKKR